MKNSLTRNVFAATALTTGLVMVPVWAENAMPDNAPHDNNKQAEMQKEHKDTASSNTKSNAQADAQKKAEHTHAKADQSRMDQDMAQRYAFKKANEVIGQKIYGSDGNELATVTDLIIDQPNGTVDYIVLNVDDGALDVGGTDYAVPHRELRWNEAQDRMMINATEERFQEMPTFNAKEWSNLEVRTLLDDVQTFFGYESSDKPHDPVMFLASDLAGADVVGTGEATIGEVDYVLIECASGKVAALVIDPADDQPADTLKLLPFSSVDHIQNGQVIVGFDAAKLAQAENAPADMKDLRYEQQIKRAYKVFEQKLPTFGAMMHGDWKASDKKADHHKKADSHTTEDAQPTGDMNQ